MFTWIFTFFTDKYLHLSDQIIKDSIKLLISLKKDNLDCSSSINYLKKPEVKNQLRKILQFLNVKLSHKQQDDIHIYIQERFGSAVVEVEVSAYDLSDLTNEKLKDTPFRYVMLFWPCSQCACISCLPKK
jgi:hypothetical protein